MPSFAFVWQSVKQKVGGFSMSSFNLFRQIALHVVAFSISVGFADRIINLDKKIAVAALGVYVLGLFGNEYLLQRNERAYALFQKSVSILLLMIVFGLVLLGSKDYTSFDTYFDAFCKGGLLIGCYEFLNFLAAKVLKAPAKIKSLLTLSKHSSNQ